MMSGSLRACSPRRLHCSALLLLSALMLCAPGRAAAEISRAEDASSLVLDPSDGRRFLSELAPGDTVQVSAMVDRLSGLTLNAYQIGLEFDASLLLIDFTPHPLASVVLKPAPAVTRFLATTLDPVRDREYEIEWETYGLLDLRLDGEPVPASGQRAHVAAGTREHVLQWNEGSDSRELVLVVDAIEEPVIEILRFDPPPPEAPDWFGVEWVVRGAHAVWWSPGDQFVSSRGERSVTIDERR